MISFNEGIGSGVNLCAVDLDADGDTDVVVTGNGAGQCGLRTSGSERRRFKVLGGTAARLAFEKLPGLAWSHGEARTCNNCHTFLARKQSNAGRGSGNGRALHQFLQTLSRVQG